MIPSAILVGLGGGLGAIGRYLLGLIPIKSPFPFNTFIINFLGALLLGYLSAHLDHKHPSLSLFWKTGVCGGFTTFSTFSLETFTLIEHKAYFLAFIYMLVSVIGCLLGILCGKKLALLS